MHTFRFMLSQQLKGTGKTTYQLQKCIEYATAHPDEKVIFATHHGIPRDISLPGNLSVLVNLRGFRFLSSFVMGKDTKLEIDPHLKDQEIVSLETTLNKLEPELERYRYIFKKLGITLESCAHL